jgi:hypothetical protein
VTVDKSDIDGSDNPEHAVIAHFRLSNAGFGTESDRDTTFHLEDRLASAIRAATVGEFDGTESGQGEIVFYMYGPDAERLFAAVEPALRQSGFARGGYAIKRFGTPGSREVRVDL